MNMNSNREWLAAATLNDPRWQQVLNRDRGADGAFFFSVKTTGVYCRPSCGARPARPENVAFHLSAAAAREAGFRACKRCKPDALAQAAQQAAQIAALCRLIERAESMPTLAELAAQVQLSPYHLHRVFKSVTGLTPRAYGVAHRAARLRDALDRGGSVTQAIYDAGFNSQSRFYEQSQQLLGMTATEYRRGAAKLTIHYALTSCSLGQLLVAQTARGICAILMADSREALLSELRQRFSSARLVTADPTQALRLEQVVALIEAPQQGLDLPLDVRGTAFQQRVWQALRQIPSGQTASYRLIAQRIGSPAAVRAVAQACAANPLAVVIPCHRVVRSDGAPSGYRWGVERKQRLLMRERERLVAAAVADPDLAQHD